MVQWGPLEVVAGLEARYPGGFFPYVGALVLGEGFWASFLMGVNFYSLSVGIAWK
ncbi:MULTISPECIES: hypothetical protein [Thermus]|uniref:hypothetical protein n=1 Tax=Thermus TaxID=270 RepID=UPI001562C346|nr:hypothetical protein [Thermus scotoductus]